MRRSLLLCLAAAAVLLLAVASLPTTHAAEHAKNVRPDGSHNKEDVAAEAAARRAAMDPEVLAEQLRTNSVDDADLLPTRPAPKQWKPKQGQQEVALLLSPGRGKGCNLKKFVNLRRFLEEDALYYPDLLVDYAVAVDPKLKFYATAAQRHASMIHGELMSEDDILALLAAGPDESKEPLLSIELMDNDPEIAELRFILEQHGVKRAEQPDPDHSSQMIFKPDFKPIED